MKFSFFKYQATGNDFILIDNRTNFFETSNYDLVARMCHRRFGIGADGLILLESSDKYDFYMRYYNADGCEGSMCGNGGRSIVHFANKLGIIKESTVFEATDGVHSAKVLKDGVALRMTDVFGVERIGDDYFLQTGSPHYVKIVPSINAWDTVAKGREIRLSERFAKEGTNVNFCTIDEEKVQILTYERGVEDETYSCGTGAVATAIVAGLKNGRSKQTLCAKGGVLRVSYERVGDSYKNIVLEGVVENSFQGEFVYGFDK